MHPPAARHHRRCSVFWLIVFAGLPAVVPVRAERSRPARSPAATTVPRPIFGPGLSSVERWHLTAAFDTALGRLTRNERCEALFDGLGLEAREALADTLYEPARGTLAKVRCQGAVVALTVVKGKRTRLCEPFQGLSHYDKAATLIHEALHRAGQGENPPDSTAPTAREIRRRVTLACGL